MRYFIHLGYDGTHLSGFQKQDTTEYTIQGILEKKLSQIFKRPITVFGCGRTDSGVHASQYFIHINLAKPLSFDLKFRLNKNLPEKIAVFDVIQVEDNQHAQFNAYSRTYDYFIHFNKDPLLIKCSSHYSELNLDYEKMHEVAALILQTKDFKPLCKHPDLYKTTICNLTSSMLFINKEDGRMRYTITSNRFLRGMVRYCIYFLLKVGTGRLSIEEFKQILNQEITLVQKEPALPNGLFLSKIEYPFLKMENKHHLFNLLKLGLE